MITCKMNADVNGLDESANFHSPNGNAYWSYEFLDRDVYRMKLPIQRFRCKDRKNNINFYLLEFGKITPNNRKVFAFKTNSDRTLFLLTYFGK